jgi:hypothetical protein
MDLDAMHADVVAHQQRTLDSVGAPKGAALAPGAPYRAVGWDERAEAFGASECGALLGVSPYESREDLIVRKAHRLRTESRPVMRIGTFLEEGILRLYAHESGRVCTPWAPRFTVASDAFPALVCTPDAVEDTGALVEIKFSGGGRGWGTGEVIEDLPAYTVHKASAAPLHYAVQCQAQLAITGREHCRLVGLIRGRLRVYEVPRHEGVIARLRDEAPKAWSEVLRLREVSAAREESGR